ncbi:hypothetical protein [Desulfovibrio cuneatus]|uniref:hypothetical protein n=1 Tax=Desulfovibrio cuneatus TaxID=159728 RepID=UPI000419AE77|nr:hypothetical protein [Desulfovibrio cuneatus]
MPIRSLPFVQSLSRLPFYALAAMLAVFLCIFSAGNMEAHAAAPKVRVAKNLINLPYAFSFEYDAEQFLAVCVAPPPAPNLGAVMYPKTGGTLRVSAAFSVGDATVEAVQNQVKGCKKVVRPGVFETYYVCKDGVRAFVETRVGNTGAPGLYQLHYAPGNKSANMALFHGIFDSFNLLNYQRQDDDVPMQNMFPGVEFIEDASQPTGFRTVFASSLCEQQMTN